MSKVRVLLADDQQIVIVGLKSVLSRMADLQIVGVSCDGSSAITQAREKIPDLVVMDMTMPRVNGVEATRQIKSQNPSIRVIMFTSCNTGADVVAAFNAGVDAYCLKNSPPDRLLTAIQSVLNGDTWMDPQIADRVLGGGTRCMSNSAQSAKSDDSGPLPFSSCELEILVLAVEGFSNAEIAKHLDMTTSEIQTAMRGMMHKLSISDRTQEALRALKDGLA